MYVIIPFLHVILLSYIHFVQLVDHLVAITIITLILVFLGQLVIVDAHGVHVTGVSE